MKEHFLFIFLGALIISLFFCSGTFFGFYLATKSATLGKNLESFSEFNRQDQTNRLPSFSNTNQPNNQNAGEQPQGEMKNPPEPISEDPSQKAP